MTESNRTREPRAEGKTSLYLYYDRNDLLLYVGITARGVSRNREHNATKEWWPFVARQEVEHYPSRSAALAAERSAIRAFHPPFNIQHNPGHELARDAYLSLRSEGRLPTRSQAHQELRWLPLDFIDFDNNRFLYATSARYSHYVEKLEKDRYGFLCALKAGKASVSRENGVLWVTIRGRAGRIGAPRLRVSPAPGKSHTYHVKGIDLIGEGRTHPVVAEWVASQSRAARRWS